jgi:hypothetical protein
MSFETRDRGRAAQEAEPNSRHQVAPSSGYVAAAHPDAVDHETCAAEAVSQGNGEQPILQTPLHESLRPLVASEKSEDRACRKRKLFCLFQSQDTAQLDMLAQQAHAPTLMQLFKSQKRPHASISKLSKRPLDLPSALALFPHPMSKDPRSPRRLSYRAKTLKELEAETLSYHLPAAAYNQLHGAQDLKPFSLRFQECSILAIARYTSRRANAPHKSIPSCPPRACVDVNFRRCGVCKKWGHYESECPHIQQLEDDRALTTDQRGIRKMARTAAADGTDVQKDVCVESCDGFMIEQRADPPNEKSDSMKADEESKQSIEHAYSGFKIKASATSFADSNSAFSSGDVVAWNLADEQIATGIVETVNHVKDSVTVRCVAISSSISSNSFLEPPDELRGAHISLPITALKRAKRARSLEMRKPARNAVKPIKDKTKQQRKPNQEGTVARKKASAFVGGMYRKPRGRDPKGMVWDFATGLWKPRKERRNINEDGTLSCSKPPTYVDGVYRKPRGRDPKGMLWDETRGVWKPRDELREAKSNGSVGVDSRYSPFYHRNYR